MLLLILHLIPFILLAWLFYLALDATIENYRGKARSKRDIQETQAWWTQYEAKKTRHEVKL